MLGTAGRVCKLCLTASHRDTLRWIWSQVSNTNPAWSSQRSRLFVDVMAGGKPAALTTPNRSCRNARSFKCTMLRMMAWDVPSVTPRLRTYPIDRVLSIADLVHNCRLPHMSHVCLLHAYKLDFQTMQCNVRLIITCAGRCSLEWCLMACREGQAPRSSSKRYKHERKRKRRQDRSPSAHKHFLPRKKHHGR